MIFKSISEVKEFIAGDDTRIREVLHPKNDEVDVPYSLAHARLEIGASSVPHILRESTEVYIIIKGNGTAFLDDRAFKMKAGDVVVIPAGVRQYVSNDGPTELTFLCMVSPPWSNEEEEIL